MTSSAASHLGDPSDMADLPDPVIPTALKFVVTNLKTIVSVQLAADNYLIWKAQIVKILRANRFERFLDSTQIPPPSVSSHSDGTSNPSQNQWILTDQILAAALCSTISPSILPYVVNLDSTAAIWTTLENRFQATNRSKVIQLKNSLHNISLKNQTITEYLSEIKNIVDQISASGAAVDTEDIILYILNGLPPSYQSFKTAIRTMLTPLSLDQLYPLLLSEEINIASDSARVNSAPDNTTALFTYRGRGRRSRGKSSNQASNSTRQPSTNPVICQICSKRGHSATACWHRLDLQYTPQPSPAQPRALAASSETNYANWFLDSGATNHLTNSLDNMSLSNSYHGSDTVTVGDGRSVNIANTGTGLLPTPNRKLSLSQILHTPFLHYNLLSISKLTKDNNISICFDSSGFRIKDQTTHQTLLQGPCENGLYPVRIPPSSSSDVALAAVKATTVTWHHRLGHPNDRVLTYIAKCNPSLSIRNAQFSCSSCQQAKAHKLVFPNSITRHSSILSLIHCDVWGPAPVPSVQGYRYYVLFVDDYSRFSWLFPMKFKSEVYNIFVLFKNQIEKYSSQTIKCLRSDGGTEFLNHDFKSFLRNNGIAHQVSCPYTPEQNGVAERKHRHIIETTRTLLTTASVPFKFWPDAALTAVYLINRLPTPNINQLTPFEMLHNSKPNYSHLRVFGCACFPLSPPHTRHKLQNKSKLSIFLGYSDTYKGYKCLDPVTNKFLMSRNLTFDENQFPFSTFTTDSHTSTDRARRASEAVAGNDAGSDAGARCDAGERGCRGQRRGQSCKRVSGLTRQPARSV
ncbi:Retrovirus-related Pol polyprotein from transposon TNT 1-94 [Dendrobium catenatum]|uniref:Retrovirus-related Pol polyprotein from transposon TNT 1-94 n=1 Tax=Dendrobium catenatum TaxID=906689 RepID=A0A2I0X6C6_9ASPA|nr:Retrovirus-related Pol polyprotein from transposon TNT 1-94 [Dendrobium catenatum]